MPTRHKLSKQRRHRQTTAYLSAGSLAVETTAAIGQLYVLDFFSGGPRGIVKQIVLLQKHSYNKIQDKY